MHTGLYPDRTYRDLWPSFTSFGFTWPTMLLKMYNIASMSSFNEQLLAPECSIGGWGFKVK
jgi:hypothetical protein